MAKVDAGADSPSVASPHHSLPHGPVEARSLSSVTAIASNPPAYPRNPTQKKLDPLELYIVRVPGSKDVFLSPLKPPTKASVSAEAINASLYYLHVSTPDDDLLIQECEQEREEEAKIRKEVLGEEADMPPEFARLNNVRRKPVPGVPKLDTDAHARPPLPARPSQMSQPETLPRLDTASLSPSPMLPPRPVLSGSRSSVDIPSTPRMAPDRDELFISSDDAVPKPPLPHRPLPPVPKHEAAFDPSGDHSVPKKANRWSAMSGYLPGRGMDNWKEKYEVLSAGRHSLDSRRPQMRPESSHASPPRAHIDSPGRSPGQSPSRRPYDNRPPERPGFHITLIRRDPTHGIQWNVATISTSKLDGGAIDIEVSTPGYNRFAAQNEPLSLASLGLNLPTEGPNRISLSSFRPTQAELAAENAPDSAHPPSQPRKFHRKLCVSRPYQEEAARGSLDLPRGSIDGGSDSPPKPNLSKLKSGYYTFTSPWNGTCTFSTSVNGRSLKCKHMIPMPPNPTGPIDNPAVTVAEIRFNTPFQAGHLHHQPGPSHISPFTLSQTNGFKEKEKDKDKDNNTTPPQPGTDPNSPPSDRASKRNTIAHFLNPNKISNRPRARSGASAHSAISASGVTIPSRKPSTSSTSSGAADLDDPASRTLRRPPSDDRLDLSLARENAGGGMRGKSAKLGKLVIEDEGIKMLDLLVASCMAVWWRGYYY
ncbi:hypothetical protein BDV25DRAFT_160878 [Aspergillus avenaceus]|uniref:Uncharacterized protein n=1 Tax=Aspergillus avenaceus TaxID=36643 RepID=A0A5N6TLI4_ASPAV|nr:hypothetical protein BDV25DRAFT_160878 [Aspergillus avenaceus]